MTQKRPVESVEAVIGIPPTHKERIEFHDFARGF